jgi:lipid-binding SYLF domain-containing protein
LRIELIVETDVAAALCLHAPNPEAAMKKLSIACAFLLMAKATFAALSNDEVKRLNEASTILTEFRDSPDKGIPDALWGKAQCVVVIPSMKKAAAFVVGGEYGSGVMSCRTNRGWTAPVFMQLMKGSWGLQIGAEQVDRSAGDESPRARQAPRRQGLSGR